MNDTPNLKVGLLLCDDVDEVDQAKYGTYAEMFRDGINAIDHDLTIRPMRCQRGEMPDSPDDFDAFLISGSRHGAYDALPWIAQLEDFVRRCREQRKKTVGICFGHQLIAQALGGEVRKADAGWGIGIHSTRIIEPRAWMGDIANGELHTPGQYNLVVVHQDQVVALPPEFRTLAANDFCPISMFADDIMLGIQGHPEFSRAFCEFRIHARRELLGEALFRQSLASLQEMTLDSSRVLGWMARFIRS